jgi:hypothetical protein
LTRLSISLLLSTALCGAQTSTATEPLKFLISVEQQSIMAPLPTRVTLHLHNSGQAPVWLYRHVQDPDTLRQADAQPVSAEEEEKVNRTTGGSTLTLRLEPVGVGSGLSGTGVSPVSNHGRNGRATSVKTPHPADAGETGKGAKGESGSSPFSLFLPSPFPSLPSGASKVLASVGLPQNMVPLARARGFEAASKLLASVGLPHPRLVKLGPGEDYEEKAVIQISPAQGPADRQEERVWGRYRLTAIYGAKYSNGDEASRDLGVSIWQGAVASNTIEIELRPPDPSWQGSVAGTVKGSQNQPTGGALVSLSDQQERLVNQALTDFDGQFAFGHLPLGLYWVTVRRPEADVDTSTFRHAELTSAAPAGTMEVLLLPPETYEPKQVLHKPVLLRIVNAAGLPRGGVILESTWSSGTVLDNVKGDTSANGTVTLNLIPGRNYLTLRQRGCPKQEQRVDVRPGSGMDDFRLTLECR